MATPPASRSSSTATPATATSTTCAAWSASSSSAASPASASRTSSSPRPTASSRRAPAAGRHRRVLRQDPGRQGRAARRRLRVVARVEALIAGWGWRRRCARRGLPRRRAPTRSSSTASGRSADEILASSGSGAGALPRRDRARPSTTRTPTEVFREAGVSRGDLGQPPAARGARGDAARRAGSIHEEQSLRGGCHRERREVFSFTANAELEDAERRYLPARRRPRAA